MIQRFLKKSQKKIERELDRLKGLFSSFLDARH